MLLVLLDYMVATMVNTYPGCINAERHYLPLEVFTLQQPNGQHLPNNFYQACQPKIFLVLLGPFKSHHQVASQ